MSWEPLSVRSGRSNRADFEGPHEGIPSWLAQSLWKWVEERVSSNSGYFDRATLEGVERNCHLEFDWSNGGASAGRSLSEVMRRDADRFLDVVDYLVAQESYWGDSLNQLEALLLQSGSAWKVASRAESFGLERRVSEVLSEALDKTVQSGSSAAQLLAQGWSEAYGKDPDPTTAYRDAVRAVESAAHLVVLPKDSTATLGKMIKAMRDAPQKWNLVIDTAGRADAIATAASMMDLLWLGQLDRHGSGSHDATLRVDRESAEAALQLAVVLVEWFENKRIAPLAP